MLETSNKTTTLGLHWPFHMDSQGPRGPSAKLFPEPVSAAMTSDSIPRSCEKETELWWPGDSAGDLFGMVTVSDPLKGLSDLQR